MNQIFTKTLVLIALSSPALATEVRSAKLDTNGENIIVNLTYHGGCAQHKFELNIEPCAESFPAQCKATVVDVSKQIDRCEAIVPATVVFNIAKHGLNKPYYSGASLSISGATSAAATITLPKVGVAKGKPVSANKINCLTHTGSALVISPSEKSVSLKSTDGKSAIFQIVNVHSISIETMHPIDQNTYTLNDGRKIVTEFSSGTRKGTGQFVRVAGDRSPEFQCNR